MKRVVVGTPVLAGLLLLFGCSQAPQSPLVSEPAPIGGYTVQAVTFDASTGMGFVGKGDIQTVFGWNNAQLQANAGSLEFSYMSVDRYVATLTWVTGEGTRGEKQHEIEIPRQARIQGVIDWDARRRNQINGFLLQGWDGDPVVSGQVPVVGETAVAGQWGVAHNGTWTSVTKVSSSGGLFVTFNGQPHQLD